MGVEEQGEEEEAVSARSLEEKATENGKTHRTRTDEICDGRATFTVIYRLKHLKLGRRAATG